MEHNTMPWILAYVSAFVSFGALDAVWLRTMVPRLYRPALGDLLARQPRMAPAVLFYALYIAGMVWFAVRPGLVSGPGAAALNGLLFGAACYMTYDLTNQATLLRWSWGVTIADIMWGGVATAVASTVACVVARHFA